MSDKVVLSKSPLGFVWETADPFLFCVHHHDHYPAGNKDMGPDPALLQGRRIGQDFSRKDQWSMYHGETIPGFPRHPHRGFETATLVRAGLIDHADSSGATARFGGGDCQWLTAGRGIEHSEMFPLTRPDADNPLELFQIWLNLPAASKMVDPYFTMLWAGDIPRHEFTDAAGKRIEVVTVAGPLPGQAGAALPPPPPDSWAASPSNEVAIWTIKMAPGARWTLPTSTPGVNRRLYFHQGERATIGGETIASGTAVALRPDTAVEIANGGAAAAELLLLQGRPIGEPVAQQGPFVLNTAQEVARAFSDYRAGLFGRWPWDGDTPVHPREAGRFAVHGDSRWETPGEA